MNLPFIVDEIASRVDDFLPVHSDRAQARAAIANFMTLDYPEVPPELRPEVIRGVMALLEVDDFFGIEFVGDAFADEDAGVED
ncbi:MAG: hypothetical protein WCQ89_05875 [Verrucomicrobiota bacterium]